jgi:hypothetical protein
MSDVYLRPRWILDLFSRRFHDTWKQVDALRERRRELGSWPDWCFLPLALVRRLIANGNQNLSVEAHQRSDTASGPRSGVCNQSTIPRMFFRSVPTGARAHMSAGLTDTHIGSDIETNRKRKSQSSNGYIRSR